MILFPQDEEAAPRGEFGPLVDAIPVALMWVNESGEVLVWNEAARTLLASTERAGIEQLMERLLAASRATHTCVQSTIELPGPQRVLVTLGPDRHPGDYLVVFDRQQVIERPEASVLRVLLKSAASGASREQTVGQALEAAHSALRTTHLALFELDPTGMHFTCVASRGITEQEMLRLGGLTNDPNVSLLAAALHHRRPVTLIDIFGADLQPPLPLEGGLAMALLPVCGLSSKGVLYLTTQGGLTTAFLGSSLALADGLAAALDISRNAPETPVLQAG